MTILKHPLINREKVLFESRDYFGVTGCSGDGSGLLPLTLPQAPGSQAYNRAEAITLARSEHQTQPTAYLSSHSGKLLMLVMPWFSHW